MVQTYRHHHKKRQTKLLVFLKINIRVHNRDLKSEAYKTLVRPQLGYASTDMNKVETIQRRAAGWAARDYRYTSSVTAMLMLKDLNRRPLDQRCIDSRLVMMYKVIYDLVAIPASDYLVWKYQSITTHTLFGINTDPDSQDYQRFTFFPELLSIGTPSLPTY